jgi:hypothetical protein
MMRKRKILPVLVALFLLGTLMTACSKEDKAEDAKAAADTQSSVDTGNVSYDAGDKTVAYKDDKGLSVEAGAEGGVEIPAGYPEDIVPLYPDGTVTLAAKDDDSYTLVIGTDDSFEDAYNYYESHIKFDSVDMKQSLGGYALLAGPAGDYYVNITIGSDVSGQTEQTQIAIAISNE